MGASGAVGGQAPASLPTTYTSLASLPTLPYTSLAHHTALAIGTHAIPAGDRTVHVAHVGKQRVASWLEPKSSSWAKSELSSARVRTSLKFPS